jgi:hypothetical protein
MYVQEVKCGGKGEKTRTEEKESHSSRSGLPFPQNAGEPNAKGWVGDSTESYTYHHDHSLGRLAKRGYESMLDYYLKVRPEQTFMGIPFTS